MGTFPDTPAIELVPDWVCEILSPGTRRFDLTEKRALYGAHGVELPVAPRSAGGAARGLRAARRRLGAGRDGAGERRGPARAVRGDGLPALGALALRRASNVATSSMTRRMIAPLVFGVLGVTVLVWLGVWQVQRLAWKTAILAEIDARLAAAPGRGAGRPDARGATSTSGSAPRGAIEPGELHVYTSAPGRGVGYRVIVPLAARGRAADPARPRLRADRREGRRRGGSGRSRSRGRSPGRRRPTASPARRTGRRTSGSPATCR